MVKEPVPYPLLYPPRSPDETIARSSTTHLMMRGIKSCKKSTTSSEKRPSAMTPLFSTKYGLTRRYDFINSRRSQVQSSPFRVTLCFVGSTLCKAHSGLRGKTVLHTEENPTNSQIPRITCPLAKLARQAGRFRVSVNPEPLNP